MSYSEPTEKKKRLDAFRPLPDPLVHNLKEMGGRARLNLILSINRDVMVYTLLIMNYDELTEKKKQLDAFRPLPNELVRNLDDWFRVELTYTSNAIEGNTLTRLETALVVEKGLTVGGKSLIEHLEATNHAHAVDWVKTQVQKKPRDINEKDILRIHEIVLKSIDDDNAGRYRRVPIRVKGSDFVFPHPLKVADLMAEFANWLKRATDLHPVELAAEAHYRLVTIHPFIDGNGRTARLLMNMILLMCGYPTAIIRKRSRMAYIASLEKVQRGDAKDDYLKIIARAVNRSLDIYLTAAKGETEEWEDDRLLKIGKLAKRVGENNSTIRHWTKQGLLEVADVTASGYQLYSPEMADRVAQIKKLKSQRLTLSEIKERIL